MRIKSFTGNIKEELFDYSLKNCDVVIDGQNYFYNLYEKSGLPYAFGCESDKYAEFLRKHLSMYKDANVRCYIIFKGGHEERDKAIKNKKRYTGESYALGEPSNEVVLPVFMKTVYKEVLKEMGIDYVVSQFESKQQCIALAQKLKCPIISLDIEFCFSGVLYIPIFTLKYDSLEKAVRGSAFDYHRFENRNNLTNKKIAIFIALSDETILTFPEGTFDQIFDNLRLSYKPFVRNMQLLQQLSKKSTQVILCKIYRYLNSEDKINFEKELERIMKFICTVETLDVQALYLLNGNKVTVDKNDPKWLEKGVANGDVAISYVNLYHFNVCMGSWCIEDADSDDAMLLSFDIIAYAFNLMTNYQRDEIAFFNKNGEEEHKDVSLATAGTIRKPSSLAGKCPFENGWDRVPSLQLFEHFLTEKSVNITALDTVPDDAKLMIVALVYFSRHKVDNTEREVYSILLSYVMLGVVFEKVDERNNDQKLTKKPVMDSITDKNLVTNADCEVANSILAGFFSLKYSELHSIFNRKMLHPLVEFQHCLHQLNNLNVLCGSLFKPTLFSKTYNGTFVYKFLYSMKSLSSEQARSYIDDMLCPAPTVLAYLNGLKDVYDELMYN